MFFKFINDDNGIYKEEIINSKVISSINKDNGKYFISLLGGGYRLVNRIIPIKDENLSEYITGL